MVSQVALKHSEVFEKRFRDSDVLQFFGFTFCEGLFPYVKEEFYDTVTTNEKLMRKREKDLDGEVS